MERKCDPPGKDFQRKFDPPENDFQRKLKFPGREFERKCDPPGKDFEMKFYFTKKVVLKYCTKIHSNTPQVSYKLV